MNVHLHRLVGSALLGALISSHVCLATPPGSWGTTTGGGPTAPQLSVDPEVQSGTTDVLASQNTESIGGVGTSVVLWETPITGVWGASQGTQTITDAQGTLVMSLKTSCAVVAVQYVKSDSSLGFGWGVRSNAQVKYRGPNGAARFDRSEVRFLATNTTVLDALNGAAAAATFFSALPAVDAEVAGTAPATAGTWGDYWDCYKACMLAGHHSLWSSFLTCLEAIGIGTGVVSGACFIGCAGVPPCVAGCLTGLGTVAAAACAACLATYLSSYQFVHLACLWECW